MKRFRLINASSLEEVVLLLQQYGEKAKLMAGGTDLLGQMKNAIYPALPEVLIDLKSLQHLQYIREDDGYLRVGALARLRDIASNPIVRQKYPALAQAAQAVASPQIRIMGTIGGNLCQDIRCWYYRASKNYFYCLRKRDAQKGSPCYAVAGDHRYHSIFGAVHRCIAVNPSDTAPALVALGARIRTTKREVEAADFFHVGPERTTVLENDEVLTEIIVPTPQPGTRSTFLKYAFRKSIDFPIINCAVALVLDRGSVKTSRICLNAVYNLPYRPTRSEEFLRDQPLEDSIAEQASEIALADAKPLRQNKYMVPLTRRLIRDALVALR
jgi:xanthine dehydrogenase YagS FAD-binding subunit